MEFDESGQLNAYFRWLAHPTIDKLPSPPETSMADVTLRRLQQFKVEPGSTYSWKLTRDGQSVASGKSTPDVAGLLTVPQVTVTTAPVELVIEK